MGFLLASKTGQDEERLIPSQFKARLSSTDGNGVSSHLSVLRSLASRSLTRSALFAVRFWLTSRVKVRKTMVRHMCLDFGGFSFYSDGVRF